MYAHVRRTCDESTGCLGRALDNAHVRVVGPRPTDFSGPGVRVCGDRPTDSWARQSRPRIARTSSKSRLEKQQKNNWNVPTRVAEYAEIDPT